MDLRAAYREARGEAIHANRPGLDWIVCVFEGEVIGCASYKDFAHDLQLWVFDFYVAEGRVGKAAALAMGRWLQDRVKRCGYSNGLFGTIAPTNRDWRELLLSKKRRYELVGLMVRWVPE